MEPDMEFDLYRDVKARTNGEMYIGVVGPVRTGKSTFVRRFMEILMENGIDDNDRRELTDELPLSGNGTAITTVEPKFIPKNAVNVKLSNEAGVKVRLIDCVGYIVNGAEGYMTDNGPRMVKTPWYENEIPFTKAAEIGTRKVIYEHSTIGVVMTTDGTIGEIPRSSYVEPEERVIYELKKIGKPFVIVLNTTRPASKETLKLAAELTEKYDVNVMPIDCEQLKPKDINDILKAVLNEFKITQIEFFVPEWTQMLPDEHYIKTSLIDIAKNILNSINKISDVEKADFTTSYDFVDSLRLSKVSMEDGSVSLEILIYPQYYYETLSSITGAEIKSEIELINIIRELSLKRELYSKITDAMASVSASGYGVILPEKEEIELFEPELIKNGSRYGVKIKAKAPSVHMIRTNIETEIAPIVGDMNQANDLIGYIKNNTRNNPEGIWETNIFGKTVEQIVDDGMKGKVANMTTESQTKIQETLQKVMNDSNGLICIIV